MSKFLDSNGVAHLWERIKQYINDCADKNFPKMQVQFPDLHYIIENTTVNFSGNEQVIVGDQSRTATVHLNPTETIPRVITGWAISGISSSSNGFPLSIVSSMDYNKTTGKFEISFYSDTPITIGSGTLHVSLIFFYESGVNQDELCLLGCPQGEDEK